MWEYLVINKEVRGGIMDGYKSPESELNKLGEEGWELVNAVNIFFGRGSKEVMFIFKREKQD